jgi:hypothetical protein
MKYIFFLTKIGSIYDVVLPLIEERKNKGEIIIVSASKEVSLFFSNHTSYKVIDLLVHPNLITRKTKHKILNSIIRSKFEFRRLFKDLSDAEIYFFGNSFSIVVFSYIHKLSRNNKIFHYFAFSEKKSVSYPLESGFRAYLLRWIAHWCLGVETVIHNNEGIPFWKLDKKFYQRNHIKERIIDKKAHQKYDLNIDMLKDKRVLITAQDLLVYDYVTKDSFIQVLDELIDLLDSMFPDIYVVKPHPREKTLYGKMASLPDIVPAYIPSEFLMDHPWDFVIGLFSTSLLSAVKLTNATVISLIDLLQWNDTVRQGEWRKIMKDSKVCIPKDFNQLSRLLQGEMEK